MNKLTPVLATLASVLVTFGATGSGDGASAITRVENAAPAITALAPASTPRREIPGCFICSFPALVAKLGTPFYSYAAAGVYRRQSLSIAAKLASKKHD